MYKPDATFDAPDDDTVIWRYCDLTKFIRVLDTKRLFFTSAALLEDRFEGSLSRPSLEAAIRELRRYWPTATEQQHVVSLADARRHEVLVNSWHIAEHESAAMWSIYGRDNSSVAIRSTFRRLVKAFSDYKHHVWIGKIRYIDYESGDIAPLDIKQWFMHKRHEFKYENELRALVISTNLSGQGAEIPCDTAALIERVYVTPTAPTFVYEVAHSICQHYGLATDILMRSKLMAYCPIDEALINCAVKPK